MRALRIICLLLALGCLIHPGLLASQAYRTYSQVTDKSLVLRAVPFNDMMQASFDARLEEARSELNYCILLAGVVWGMVLLTKESPLKRGDLPEIGMFLSANAIFVIHTLAYVGFVRLMSGLAAAGAKASSKDDLKIPDFTSDDVAVFAETQLYTLLFGAIIAALLLFSTHRLKEPTTHEADNRGADGAGS